MNLELTLSEDVVPHPLLRIRGVLEVWPSGFIACNKQSRDYQLEHAESTAQSIKHASLAVYQLGHAEEGLHAQEKDNYISEDNL